MPNMEQLLGRLPAALAALPPLQDGLVHGDFRLDNLLVDPDSLEVRAPSARLRWRSRWHSASVGMGHRVCGRCSKR